MTKRQEKFWKLSRQFDNYHGKTMWWNGAEFGTLLGALATLFTDVYWWLFGAFCVEFGFVYYYQHKNKKILKEMEKLAQEGK